MAKGLLAMAASAKKAQGATKSRVTKVMVNSMEGRISKELKKLQASQNALAVKQQVTEIVDY